MNKNGIINLNSWEYLHLDLLPKKSTLITCVCQRKKDIGNRSAKVCYRDFKVG